MRALAILLLVLFSSCNKDDERGGGDKSKGATAAEEIPPGFGSLALSLEPKDGAAPESVAGATVTVANHPETTAVADASGNVTLETVSPGTLSIYVLSDEGGAAALTAGAAKYGLKIDDVVVKAAENTDLGTKQMKETGSIAGTIAFFENPNDLDLVGSEVFIPGTSFIAKTDKSGKFSLQGIPEGAYALRAQHSGFAVVDLEVTVPEGGEANVGTIALSLSKGPEGSITIGETEKITIDGESRQLVKSRTVVANLKYDADAALMRISDEPSFLSKSWIPVEPSVEWTFDSDGEKSLYVMFSDLNGLESAPFADTVIVDTEKPTISSVKILYGWGQTAAASVFVDVESADAGTGVKEVAFSNDGTFEDSWTAIGSQLDWNLTSGLGTKTVHARVRDHAGHVSEVATDGITLGTTSVIAELEYKVPMLLKEAQSPFVLAGTIVFESDLAIEPGVTVLLDGEAELDVRGKFTAVGTASKHITIRDLENTVEACSGSTDGFGRIRFDRALPGVTEKNKLKYVDIKKLSHVIFNGGTVTNSTFDGRCSSGGKGIIQKLGLDAFTFTSNTWTNWWTGLKASAGTSNIVVSDNGGSVVTALTLAGATGVTFKDMSFTAIPVSGIGFFNLESGSVTTSNISVSGETDVVFRIDGEGDFTLTDIEVAAATRIVDKAVAGTLTISNSTIAADYGIRITTVEDEMGPVVINSSSLDVLTALVRQEFEENGTGSGAAFDLTVNDSDITCGNPGPTVTCDLYQAIHHGISFQTATFGTGFLIIAGSNISCPDGRCTGFVYQDSGATANGTVSVTLTGNYWADKTNGLRTSLVANKTAYDSMSIDGDYWLLAEEDTDLTWEFTQDAQSATAVSGAGDSD